jgi:hypothetical protein
MRRYIGGVTTRRSPRPRKRAAVAGIPGTAKAKAELFQRLCRAFETAPEARETPERTRERYVLAIDSVADYLEIIGADPVWVERFDDLSGALEEGALPDLLRRAIPKA